MRAGLIAGLLSALAWMSMGSRVEAACVLCSCSINASDVAFGVFQPLDNASLNGTGSVTVTCGPLGVLADYDVKLTSGGSGAFATRRMTSGINTLPYNLYTTAAYTTVWGDGTAGTGFRSDSWLILLGSASRTYAIYGRIPPATTTPAGAYTDTIIARVEF